MKNLNNAVIVVLFIVLGVQAYMLFRMDERINQLTVQETPSKSAQIAAPNSSKLDMPKLEMNDDFFKGRSWSAYEEMQHLQNEIEQMFGESISRFHMNSNIGGLTKLPAVDLQEKPDQYIVTVNAPGADEPSISVKIEDQYLHISIKTEKSKEETDEKNDNYRYRERFVGEFQRVLALPGPADAAKMKTDYHNGVLTINIPKK